MEMVDMEPKNLRVYPSPASTEIYLKEDLTMIAIYSSDGMMVLQKSDYSKLELLDISTLRSGTYFLSAGDKNDEISTVKFFKVTGR